MPNVRDLGAVGDGIADDTAAIQAALDAGGHVRIPYTPKGYVISDALRIHSRTWLEVDPGTRIFEASGSNVVMLRNADLRLPSTDADIRITGGIWDNNWKGNPGVDLFGGGQFFLRSSKDRPVRGASGTIGMFGVSGFSISDLTVVDQNHFGIQVSACHRFQIRNIHFVRTEKTISDGVHINGPSSRFLVENITGATGDDFIALNAWDWNDSSPATAGDISKGVIRNLRPDPCTWGAVKMTVGTGAGVHDVTVSDVKGTSTFGGFIIGNFIDQLDRTHVTGKGLISGIRLQDIAIRVTETLVFDGDIYGCGVYINCDVVDLTIDGVQMTAEYTTPARPWLAVRSGNRIGSLSVRGFHCPVAPASSRLFDFNGTVGRFSITDSDFIGPGAGDALIRLDGASAVAAIDIAGLRLAGWAGLLEQASGAGACSLSVADAGLATSQAAITVAGMLVLRLNAVDLHGCSAAAVQTTDAASRLDAHSAACVPPAVGAVLIRSAGVVRWNGLDLPLDAALLTPFEGDLVRDVTSGPVIRSAGTWARLGTPGR